MIRLLIVDDEPIIVNSLYQLLRDAIHLELEVYRAYNVYEALNCLHTIRVDVVISDIRMPGMTGIELHQKIMESWPRCKVIFLTGYDEFEYARHAIRTGGVIDYLLKNEDDNIILEAVEKAIKELEKVEDSAEYILKAKEKLQLAIPALQKNTLFDLLRDSSRSLQERENKFTQAEIPLLSDERVFLVVGRIDEWNESYNESDRMLLIYACQNIAEEYLNPTVVQISVVFDLNKVLWFMQPQNLGIEAGIDKEKADQAWQSMKTRVYGIMESVQEVCKKLLKLAVSFVIGRESCEWQNSGAQFDYLKGLLGHGFTSGQELLIQDDDQFGMDKDPLKRYHASVSQNFKKQFELLEQYLASGQREHYHKLYNEIMNPDKLFNTKEQVELFYSISLFLTAYSIQIGQFQELLLVMNYGQMTQYDAHKSWIMIVAYFTKVADYLFEISDSFPEEQGQRMISTINQYIQNNLAGDLSLTKLSTVVHHSPTYLSRLYKRMTGMMLSNYISEERMKHTQHLLTRTSIKIQEIATVAGYEAAPQFNRSFKKMFKMTPQEYRDLFSLPK